MAIFVASITVNVAIEADSVDDALIDAMHYAAQELMENASGEIEEITEITDPKLIPNCYKNILPWGGDGRRTVWEILNPTSSQSPQPTSRSKNEGS